jgi:hypothetical protein
LSVSRLTWTGLVKFPLARQNTRQSKPTTEEEWNLFTATTSAIMADVVAASRS